jgi:hypothetical protein
VTIQTPEPSGPRERDPGQARRRPRWRSPGAVVVAVVALVAVGLAVPVARELLEHEPDTPVRGHPWERLPGPPANDVLRGPDPGSAVWTGNELILLGASAYAPPQRSISLRPPNALAYDPASRRWRVLPDPPLQPDETGGGAPIWTGEELLLVSGVGTPLAYDPDADTWRRLAPPPAEFIADLAGPAAVWTGAEVLFWDTLNHDEATGTVVHGGRGAAYNPRTDRWRHLPPSPLASRTWSIVAWTGGELLVIAGSCGEDARNRCEDGAAYDPAANTWTPIPALAGGAIAPEAASAWTGSELIVWPETGSTASAYNPRSGRWRTLPPAPITPRRLPGAVWAGDRLLVWGGIRGALPGKLAYPDDGAAYDPRANRWQRLPRAPVPGRALPLTAWTGDQAIFIGGQNVGAQPRLDRGNIAAIAEQGVAYWPAARMG